MEMVMLSPNIDTAMAYEINLGLQNVIEGTACPEDAFVEQAEKFILEPAELLEVSAEYHLLKFPYSFEPGIYFLFQDERMVYVGKASSLEQRLRQHYQTKKFNRVTYLTGIPPLFLEEVEAFYIHAATPDFNLSYPPKSRVCKAMLGMIQRESDKI